MNIGKLEKNLRDLILEEQIKLGYRKELLRLYYPLSSLNHLLGVNCTEAEMLERMKEFSEATQEHFGGITASSQKERFCRFHRREWSMSMSIRKRMISW